MSSPTFQRPSERKFDELRPVSITTEVSRYAEGSCLIKMGHTHVLCTASVDTGLPRFAKEAKHGWLTAEYGMLPRSTHTRTDREAARGKQSGRTQEIQRLIGRSLRSVTDLKAFPEHQIRLDCDVLQADGGTRTAAITGSWVALHQALQHMQKVGIIDTIPLKQSVAAISCGICQGQSVLDLEYTEDSTAETDANFVMTGDGRIIEIQGTAEADPFSEAQFLELLQLAKKGVTELTALQSQALGLPLAA